MFKSLRRCKKTDSKSDFSQNFRLKACFFSKNTPLRNKLSKKVGKRQIWHFNNVNCQRKKIFGSKLSKKSWCFETSFTWKSVALLEFPFKTWCVLKRCFKIRHAVKLPIQKMTICCKLNKNWLIYKTLIRIWRFVKNLFESQILFQSFDRITVFFSIFYAFVFFEKTHSCKSWHFVG